MSAEGHVVELNPAQLVSVQACEGASVRLGWFHREPVFVFGYDDGRYVVGYRLHASADSYVVVPLAEIPFPARETGRS